MDSSEHESFAERVTRRARELGFAPVGITDAAPFEQDERRSLDWLAAGHQAGLGWMTPERQTRACRPSALLEGARSLVVVGASYAEPNAERSADHAPCSAAGARADDHGGHGGERARGRVARYARGLDYHDVMKARLHELADFIRSLPVQSAADWSAADQSLSVRPLDTRTLGSPDVPDDAPTRTRVFVDASPLVERAAAVRAGLGFVGKNTNLLTADAGSWLLLGAVLTTLPLRPDPPTVRDCGQCRLCLDACPTNALPEPFVLDANRCISYLTIEHKGPIPRDLRAGIGAHVFGCDVCQDVCPWNRRTRTPAWPELAGDAGADPADAATPVLRDLLALDDARFRARYRATPVARTKRRGLLRNAAVALGNRGDARDVPALAGALADTEPLVRGHAAWALGRIGGEAALGALRAAQSVEPDGWVLDEIDAALAAHADGDALAVTSMPAAADTHAAAATRATDMTAADTPAIRADRPAT